MNQVLLVGDETARLEVDLVPYGMSCQTVADAKGAVDELKSAASRQQPWASVVVSAALPDMTGPAFVDGLMRHFNPDTVVLVADVEPHIAQHLSSSPKVHIFSAGTDGVVIADHLFKRLGTKPAPPPPPPPGFLTPGGVPPSLGGPPPPPQPGGAAAGLAALFEPPRTAAGGMVQQTPQQPFAMPPPTSPGWGPPGTARPQTTMPFFQVLQAQAPAPPQPPPSTPPLGAPIPSTPPQPTGPDRATLARIEAMADELAGANAEVITLKARLQAAEARAKDTTQKLFEKDSENAALVEELRTARTELDMVRHAATTDVAEISAIADDGLQQQLDNVRIELHGAMTDRDGALGQLELVRAERDQLTGMLNQLRTKIAEANADLEQQRAVSEALEQHALVFEQANAKLEAAHALSRERDVERDAAIAQLQGHVQELTQARQAAAAAHAAAMVELEREREGARVQAEALAAMTKNADDAAAQLSAATADLAAARAQAKDGAAQLQAATRELAATAARASAAEGERDAERAAVEQSARVRNAAQEAQLAELQARLEVGAAGYDELRAHAASVESALVAAQGALVAARGAEQNVLAALRDAEGRLEAADAGAAERDARAHAAESALAAAQSALSAARGAEQHALQDALGKLAAADARAAERDARASAAEAALADAQAALVAARTAEEQVLAARHADQGRLDAAAARAAELDARAQAAEADLAQLEDLRAQLSESERYAKLEEARANRAVDDAAGMRRMIELQTHEQARIVGEIEQLRPIAAEVERARAAIVDMQRQLEATLGTDEADGNTEGAIEEAVRARTRGLLELARAIEPFAWGLDQAVTFFGDANLDGAQRHVQSMKLLQKTLERLKNELEKLHYCS